MARRWSSPALPAERREQVDALAANRIGQ